VTLLQYKQRSCGRHRRNKRAAGRVQAPGHQGATAGLPEKREPRADPPGTPQAEGRAQVLRRPLLPLHRPPPHHTAQEDQKVQDHPAARQHEPHRHPRALANGQGLRGHLAQRLQGARVRLHVHLQPGQEMGRVLGAGAPKVYKKTVGLTQLFLE
jgi:hypothetical protein